MSDRIESRLREDRRFHPGEAFAARARLSSHHAYQALYRQSLDTSGNPTGDWEPCGYFTPDVTGRWRTPPQPEGGISNPVGSPEPCWQYGTVSTGGSGTPDCISNFITREYAQMLVSVTKAVRDLAVDFVGNLFSVWSNGPSVLYSIRRWLGSKPGLATVAATLGQAPTVLHTRKDGRGGLTVTYGDKNGNFGYLHSHNDLRNVDVNTLSYNLSWTPIKTCISGPFRFIVGFDSGTNTWRCARAAAQGGALIPFADNTTSKMICAGVVAEHGLTAAGGVVVCDLPVGTNIIGTYYSENSGENWVEAPTS